MGGQEDLCVGNKQELPHVDLGRENKSLLAFYIHLSFIIGFSLALPLAFSSYLKEIS